MQKKWEDHMRISGDIAAVDSDQSLSGRLSQGTKFRVAYTVCKVNTNPVF
jgi:hypothetical protein